MNGEDFNSFVHAYLDTRNSGFIVRLVKGTFDKARRFTLAERQNGLCKLKPLASAKTHYKKCYWYSEFVVSDRDTTRDKQLPCSKDTISRYLTKFLQNLDIPEPGKATQLSIEECRATKIQAIALLQSSVMSSFANWGETGSNEESGGRIAAAKAVRGSPDPGVLLDAKEECHWKHTRELGTGGMTRKAADRLLEAYKV
ncbi:hypothetical protein FBEOM_3455 [Fusarium beomiforme]|uniref:Uncharacterized protein n=1 Tax=Fusarium beomiforme TaxID=44412 RepID=A0A9P5E1Y2_9HYPO|nr:hypothetical protein FBEOM_3455 [Fusarium beomiforme]